MDLALERNNARVVEGVERDMFNWLSRKPGNALQKYTESMAEARALARQRALDKARHSRTITEVSALKSLSREESIATSTTSGGSAASEYSIDEFDRERVFMKLPEKKKRKTLFDLL